MVVACRSLSPNVCYCRGHPPSTVRGITVKCASRSRTVWEVDVVIIAWLWASVVAGKSAWDDRHPMRQRHLNGVDSDGFINDW
jgi:hypothetical protein